MTQSIPLQPRKRPVQQRAIAMVDAILDASARILVADGYAGLNTNAVARQAGVSIGSFYQYFPSKEALLVSLQERHAREMSGALGALLDDTDGASLHAAIVRLVRAAVAAHEVAPALHRVLEKQLPFFEENTDLVGRDVHRYILALLTKYRAEVAHPNLELATWMTMRMTEALVHAAVLELPAPFDPAEVETAVSTAIFAFLTTAPRANAA